MRSSQEDSPKVFISYSHKDKKWLERLQVHLKPLEREGPVDPWDDTRIKAGSRWWQEIQEAINSAKVAVLLISADFLASDFIANNELPPLLAAAKTKGTVILPVILKPCRFAQTESLSQFQAVNPDLKPLSKMSQHEREALWVKLTEDIVGALKSPSQDVETALPRKLWNVPYERNPFFTGREKVLEDLRAALTKDSAAALSQTQAIHGLGGIGKTQTAVEYAYRYRDQYKAVFWVRAATELELRTGFVEIARVLDLPEKDAQDQDEAVRAVKRRLEAQDKWLLILDNAEDLSFARDFLPPGRKGHTLLTTRAHAVGAMGRIEIDEMEPNEGALFLLRRAKIIADDAPLDAASAPDQATAREISIEVDGLPLALDQAGAFIEEMPSSPAEYLDLYGQQGAKLRAERGGLASDHPSVTVTFSLAFNQVEARNKAAADLIRVCAFLAPDAIPEEIFIKGAAQLGEHLSSVASDALAFTTAMHEAARFSLIRRNPENKSLDIHRLVQEVVKDEMDVATCRLWAERVVRAVNQAFPDIEFASWPLCDRLLPHAKAAGKLVEEWNLEFTGASRLLNQTAVYLYNRAQYAQAEPLYTRALAIWEKALGPDHPNVAACLNNLAELYRAQGQYAQAEPLYTRALAIREKALGPDHPDVATSLNNLAALYKTQGQYAQAEPLYTRALAIREKALGPDHPAVAASLNNLAGLYHDQGQYAQAEPLYTRALAIREKALGPDHPAVATSLENYAALLRDTQRDTEAEKLEARAKAIRDKHTPS